jgi:hypothetical protein
MAPPPSPLGRWKVSFESLLPNGSCNSASGFLLLWPNNWLALVNHKDSPLVGKTLRDGEVFYLGSSIRFPNHLVLVQTCLVSPPGFFILLGTSSSKMEGDFCSFGYIGSKNSYG